MVISIAMKCDLEENAGPNSDWVSGNSEDLMKYIFWCFHMLVNWKNSSLTRNFTQYENNAKMHN